MVYTSGKREVAEAALVAIIVSVTAELIAFASRELQSRLAKSRKKNGKKKKC